MLPSVAPTLKVLEPPDALLRSSLEITDGIQADHSIFPFSYHPRLNQVFQFIERHYQQSITLCQVARAVGYSPAYLTDWVRRETGKTVNNWIIERRLVEACRLLLKTEQTVNQIAESMGYQNPGYFFRQFRQRYGMSPQVWRKLHRL